MSLQQTLTMLLERGNAVQAFWSVYITVTLGLLAFFGSKPRSIRLAVILSAAFVAFGVVNCGGMLKAARQRQALYKMFHTLVAPDAPATVTCQERPCDPPLASARGLDAISHPLDPRLVAVFHVIIDLLALASMWYLTLRPQDPHL